jgi:lipopolysaccharide transport system permease protein
VGVGVVDFLIAFGLLAVLMAVNAVGPSGSVVVLPVVGLLLVALTLGMGILLSALTVAYRDFRYVVPFGVQLWMFATPSIYLQADTALGPRSQLLLPLNPAYGLVLNFRQAVLGGPPDWYALAVSGAVSLALLALGCLYFHRVERSFADII